MQLQQPTEGEGLKWTMSIMYPLKSLIYYEKKTKRNKTPSQYNDRCNTPIRKIVLFYLAVISSVDDLTKDGGSFWSLKLFHLNLKRDSPLCSKG